jgi:hypothetical protein
MATNRVGGVAQWLECCVACWRSSLSASTAKKKKKKMVTRDLIHTQFSLRGGIYVTSPWIWGFFSFSIVVKYTYLPFLNVQFCGIKYILSVKAPLLSFSRTFSSSPTETQYSLNWNSPFSSPQTHSLSGFCSCFDSYYGSDIVTVSG